MKVLLALVISDVMSVAGTLASAVGGGFLVAWRAGRATEALQRDVSRAREDLTATVARVDALHDDVAALKTSGAVTGTRLDYIATKVEETARDVKSLLNR